MYIYIYMEHNLLLRYFPRDTREPIKFENGRNKGATKMVTVVYEERKMPSSNVTLGRRIMHSTFGLILDIKTS